MKDILTDLSTPALIQAIKANLLEFFQYLGRATETDFYAGEKFVRWQTRLPHPWFNGVLALQPPSPEDARVIEDTVAYFKARDVAVFTWWLNPQLAVDDWTRYLLPRGFKVDHDTPGMAIDLKALPADIRAGVDLKIVPVEDRAALAVWAHTFMLGYELPLSWEKDFWDLMAGIGLDLPVRNYLGYLDGEPVATSNLFLGAGVAGIQCVATLPHARGRGLGAALTAVPLYEARDMGYHAGILQSSDMGFKVYQRLGFQQLCDMEHFYRVIDIDLE